MAAVLENEKINKKLRAKTQFVWLFSPLILIQGTETRAFTGNRVEPNLKAVFVYFVCFSAAERRSKAKYGVDSGLFSLEVSLTL